MGISLVDGGGGTLVWIQRKDGSWWPGRIVSPGELAPSARLFDLSLTKTPIKLLGTEDASVRWYNLEKSKRIKSFRCGEFDDCIERASSNLVKPIAGKVKNVCREAAIIHAVELEKQEFLKKHKRPGTMQPGTICRAKRSRCIYLPVDSNDHVDPEGPKPQSFLDASIPSEVDDYSPKSDSAKGITSSTLTKICGSNHEFCGAERTKLMKQLSGEHHDLTGNSCRKVLNEFICFSDLSLNGHTCSGHGMQKKPDRHKLTARPRVIARKDGMKYNNLRLKKGNTLTSRVAFKNHKKTQFDANILIEKQVRESGAKCGDVEKAGKKRFRSVNDQHHKEMSITLMDVELTVQASCRGGPVPLISLMSRLNGKAIIGHPIEIEALDYGSAQIFLLGNDNTDCRTREDDSNTSFKLMWRTSKRTPVSYIPIQDASPNSEKNQTGKSQATLSYGSPRARKSGCSSEELLSQPLKEPNLSGNESTKGPFCSEPNSSSAKQTGAVDGLLKQETVMPNAVASDVPVKLIYGRLLESVGKA